jgi:type II secretory pathway component PulJ
VFGGFTVVEVLVAIFMFGLILFGIMQVFEPTTLAYPSAQRTANAPRTGRTAMEAMAREIRMAGYFPENADKSPENDQSNAIELATNAALAVAGDVDGTGATSTFLFCLDAGTLRRVHGPRGAASSYHCLGGSVLAEHVDRLAFAYYDAFNTPLPNPPTGAYDLDGQAIGSVPSFATASERAAIRRVVITVTATEAVPNQPPQTYTLTSDVRLRNP